MSSLWTWQDSNREKLLQELPSQLPILPLRNTVAFPFSMLPLIVGIPRSMKLVEEAMEGNHLIGLVAMRDPSIDEPGQDQVFEVGTVGVINKVMRTEDGKMQVIVQGLERIRISNWLTEEPYLTAEVGLVPDVVIESVELQAMRRSLIEFASRLVKLQPQMPNEIIQFVRRIEDPRLLVYLVAANIEMEMAQAQHLLEIDHVTEKMRMLIGLLSNEIDVLELGKKIQTEAQTGMEEAQREYYLREQLKAIKRELGEDEDGAGSEAAAYRKKLEAANLPEEADREAKRELERMSKMMPQSAEYGVIKTYLDWLLELPWNEETKDDLDIGHARRVLNEDHYDLTEIKDRILEFLAVRKLREERGLNNEIDEDEAIHRAGGTILCFVGPPGTGKTSLGRSIAHALGRKFTRMSLGGVRDESEIRGHRRTYVGAMPGRIMQALKRVGTRNPVFMLDEVDKMGADWRGDPSSALLEVLDPQQNHAFRDHYLDVDFDLSDVIFVATANMLDPIPAPLRDRMEILTLDGYTEYEKTHIAVGYLIPRQRTVNGLQEDEVNITEEGLRELIRNYTREAGVRNLERVIGSVFRKVATRIAEGTTETPVVIDEPAVHDYLGKPKFQFEAALRTSKPGVATGLAVTSVGGEVLFVEAAQMRGSEKLILTGQLGDVMRESARIALSHVQAHCDELGLAACLFEKSDIHLHVPAGATPKDGPSAGVTMVTALTSLFSGVPVRADVGMTGEVTLQGQVLPIGGLKQKVLAAHRAGLKTVILPKRNEADLEDVPEDVRAEMTFVLADSVQDVLDAALEKVHPVEVAEPATPELAISHN